MPALNSAGRGARPSALSNYAAAYEAARQSANAALGINSAGKLKRADALIASVFEKSFDGILVADIGGCIELSNDAAARLFGFRRGTIAGHSIFDLIPAAVPPGGLREMDPRSETLSAFHEATGRRASGCEFPLEIGAGVIHVGDDKRLVYIVRDITDRKAQEARLQYQAMHDALTGLPNRAYLAEHLDQALAIAERACETAALLMLDLDRFKEVNDTLGHAAGDALLCDVARRLRSSLRTSDAVARLGGDEFAAVLPAGSGIERARRVAARIAQSLREPFTYDGVVIEIGGSIGVALYPDHGGEKERLLQCADVAMYAAKETQSGIAIYQHDGDRYSVRQLTLANELRRAIDQNEIFLEYQPKLDIRRCRIFGLEALARWHHPTYGRVGPDEFVAQAERCGLTQQLTVTTVTNALEQMARWRAIGLDLTIAINLSAREMHNKGLPTLLSEQLSAWDVNPDSVTIEITESALMRDPGRALEIANAITEIGCHLAIDDFGTGYSSLSYLSRLPVDELKIDKSFVLTMAHARTNATIVHSTIDLAHNLGLNVVSEGVETEEIMRSLFSLDCDVAQGFLIGQPMPAEAVADWLQSEALSRKIRHLTKLGFDSHAAA